MGSDVDRWLATLLHLWHRWCVTLMFFCRYWQRVWVDTTRAFQSASCWTVKWRVVRARARLKASMFVVLAGTESSVLNGPLANLWFDFCRPSTSAIWPFGLVHFTCICCFVVSMLAISCESLQISHQSVRQYLLYYIYSGFLMSVLRSALNQVNFLIPFNMPILASASSGCWGHVCVSLFIRY